MPFQDRVNIPREEFISGDEVMAQWKQHGAYFLAIFSYSWITAEHPDPKMFHLRRIVRVLEELEHFCARRNNFEITIEMGVIIDFCSLWQKGNGETDKRTEAQIKEFKDGLQEINTPYAHCEITAVKLTAVPAEVSRAYDDRGWTLFESIIIDGKAASQRLQLFNWLTVDEKFGS
jgi:hypothetical protein